MAFSRDLKDYTFKELLGTGTFGKVYHGIHNPNGVHVAIKLVDFEKLKQNKNGMARIQMEIEVQSKLNHNGIVKLYQSFITIDDATQRQQYVLILEHLGGGNLRDFLKQQNDGKLCEPRCFALFSQLVDIVRYLHRNETIHRDLKLQNILLCADSDSAARRIKLCDFGLATSTAVSPDRYTMCGTPNFVAPEIAKHEKHSYSVDVWSLGIILVTLLTGSPPFHTGNTRQTLSKVINHTSVSLPASLSSSVRALVAKLLSKEPTQRISSFDIANTEWFLRRGGKLPRIDFAHLSSRRKALRKSGVTIEISEGEFARILWGADRDSHLSVGRDHSIRVVDAESKRDESFDAGSLPTEYCKAYDLLAKFVRLISSRTPMLALFVKSAPRKHNALNLKRLVLLHNKDVDFSFSSSSNAPPMHYSNERDAFDAQRADNDEKATEYRTLVRRAHAVFAKLLQSGHTRWPVEMKFDLQSQTAIHHFERSRWRYYLSDGMVCRRSKEERERQQTKQMYEFESNRDIVIVVKGKQTPYLLQKGDERQKIGIASERGAQFKKYWKCIMTVLQL